jgi:hypothetical protein
MVAHALHVDAALCRQYIELEESIFSHRSPYRTDEEMLGRQTRRRVCSDRHILGM